MRPGRRFIRALTMLCIAALLVPLAPVLAVALGLALLALFAAGAYEAWQLRSIVMSNDRPSRIALALDESEAIPFAISSSSGSPLHLVVRQSWPRLVDAFSDVHEALLRPGEIVRYESAVRGVIRGVEPLAAPVVAMTRWHLAERIVQAGTAGEISVIPNTHAVGRLHRQINDFILRGMGSRMAPRRGKGREFDRLRDYVSGDDRRDVAWRASARHGKLIVREFRVERAQEIVLCLDRGHRMAARVERISRLDHAVNAILLLTYLCKRMEDRVAVTSFAERVDRGIQSGRGAAHLRQVTQFLTEVQPDYRFTDYLALAANVRRGLHHRSLIMIFTVLPETQERAALLGAVRMLAPQHLPVVIVLGDPDLEAAASLRPADVTELSRVLVASDLRSGRQTLMQELRHSGALVVETPPHDVPTAAVNAYIDVKRRQLL
jgi:uncharacterized protein (DUF58 family)